jgi:hypothetical protein
MNGELGPGKYGEQCEELLCELNAKAVLLIVLEGNKGSGMSLSQEWNFDLAAIAEQVAKLPALLRHVADSIEATLK